MRRPISVCVLVFAMVLASSFGLTKMPRDILPSLGIPIIYVAQPYGGLDPSQMESYITYFYEYHFLYIAGIEHVESKNIQSTALIKLQFHPGTDMAEAMAETVSEVNRSRAFMPAGTNPPFVIRFDAGSEPVGKLVFSSDTRRLGELQNYALNYVRPLFSSLKGVSAPPPFGASARTIVIEVDPAKLKQRDLSPDQVTHSIVQANTIVPSGNIHSGTLYPLVPLNSIVLDPQELLNVPLRLGVNPTTLLRDVATVQDGNDIQTGYALVNGKRTVYIPITKRADASTLAVVDTVKANIPRFQSVIPSDIKVSYEFDQSGYVKRAIGSLFWEALLGAILTGLMVFLFLRDWRSVLIVALNIPLALLFSILFLWISGQTVNIMTLGGLALAVGILVDETTVTIENIHSHFTRNVSVARATLDATNEILKPALLTLLCVLSVFIPSFFMEGVTRALFVPLTLGVGFSMIGSFILSRTLVPILSAWFLKKHFHHAEAGPGFFTYVQKAYGKVLARLLLFRRAFVLAYLAMTLALIMFLYPRIGTEIFPQVDVGQFQLRLKAPTGTSIENTEQITLKYLEIIKDMVGPENLEASVAFVGTQPPNYAISTIFLFTAGPQEGVLEVALRPEAKIKGEEFKEELRRRGKAALPDVEVSFEPSNLVDRTMSQGTTTPIEIGVSGSNIANDREFSKVVYEALQPLPFLRDLQYKQQLDYPAFAIEADRLALGHKGLTMYQLGQALVPATSSSRYLVQNYWRDAKNGINYQVQVQVPQRHINSLVDLEKLPIQGLSGDANPLKFYAHVAPSTKIGEYDRYNMQRTVSVTANLHGIDLGHAATIINERLAAIADRKPRGTEVRVIGQIPALKQMLSSLGGGLVLAIGVVFLLLAANFESVWLALAVLSTMPAVIAGSLMLLIVTGTTLNIESFMGTILGVGVAVANAILLVTFAEHARKKFKDSAQGAVEGALTRLRPILMTGGAMLAGMMPMALALGEGGEQTAPLGRAVIGGLLGSTAATLFLLPLAFAWIQNKRTTQGPSLDPDDSQSINAD
ncbi:MAG: efflux RND transporter permease subunit [Deltaproteobacteria bacterium]|nr:efflux RND transporter permease subunit [Deltaproteobacteria bacterium]